MMKRLSDCNVWRYNLWRMQSLHRERHTGKNLFQKKEKEKKQARSVSTSFKCEIRDGRIVHG